MPSLCSGRRSPDFFRFIDVRERHPFSGTGNLLKFAEELAKMRCTLLPKLEQFRAFPARGPEGVSEVDINRRVAAIECYLDLEAGGYPPAKVIWTNYKKELDIYQASPRNTVCRVLRYKKDQTTA